MDLKQWMIPVASAAMLMAAADAAWAQDRGDRGGRQAGQALAQIDLDGDGVISEAEFVDARLARAESRFLRRDRNGDGVISADDFEDVERPEPPEGADREAFRACVAEALGVELPEPREPGDRLAEVDLNGDEAIDLDEALISAEARALERFAILDGNGDGFVDRDEIRASLAQASELREIRRACRDQQAAVASFLEG
ncbi:MAG: hypothetical protein AAGE01_02685 [Pseudomonadota bacterium]